MSAPRIRRLPDHLVNKIAAGEVVERPASVVKELVENALDALCTQVTVDLRDAGRALIRVTDDGVGMSSDEVDLALLRHATSKLATDADLDAITTLGFRGEALPAICAVTRFSVLSCPRGAETGTLVRGEGGTVNEKLLVAAPAGTTVEAQDLFFNTPARLKFMKSAQSEVAAALRLLEAIALAHQDVHFRVSHNGRPALGAPRARSLRDRIGALWGFERAGKLLEVERKDGPLAVSGLIAPPQLARGNRDEIVLIVNGRPVRDTQLSQTLIEAYRPLLARDQFPIAVLHLELPPQEVDVNVHPTKAWVRFRSPRQVQEILYRAVHDALRQSQVVQAQRGLGGLAGRGDAPGDMTGSFSIESGGPEMAPALPQAADIPAPAGQASLFHEPPAQFTTANFGTVIGQLQDTFIVCGDRRRDLLSGSARGARARAVRAAAGRAGRGPAGLAGAALPAARRAGRGPGGLGPGVDRDPRGAGLPARGLERLHGRAARGAGAAPGPGAAAPDRGAGRGRRPPAQR